MTKIDIFSGFLGAGKTTLIKKLIKESFAGQKVVLIENEFGEIGIDGGFLKESGIQINELNAGCICCSLVGDFRAALQQVVEQYHPDRIVIEPSGVGKLSDVTRAVEGVAEHLDVQLSSFVTVADVNKVKMYMKNFGEFYDDQISHASCIILSRTQNATEEKIAAAVAMLREKNPTATIVTTAWDALTGEQILKAMSTKDDFKAELIAMAAKANAEHAHEDEEEEHEHHHHHDHDDDHDEHCCCGHHHDHDDDDEDEHEHHHHHDHDDHDEHCCCGHHHHHARHDDEIAAFVFESDRPFDPARLDNYMRTLTQVYGPDMLRYKGVLYMTGTDRKMIFQGVHMLMAADLGKPWGDTKPSTKMVFIGRRLPKKAIMQGLETCLA